MDPSDLDLFNKFLPPTVNPTFQAGPDPEPIVGQGVNLADLILEQIAAHEAAHGDKTAPQENEDPQDADEIPAKVVEVYTK